MFFTDFDKSSKKKILLNNDLEIGLWKRKELPPKKPSEKRLVDKGKFLITTLLIQTAKLSFAYLVNRRGIF